jgi:predicted O-methyltransferase YrrM
METLRIRGILHRSGVGAAPTIPTFTSRDELEALFRLAEECPADAKIVEIGSYLGASTCFIAAGLRGTRASIVCVDTWQNETMPEGTRDTLEEFKRNIAGVNGRVQLIRRRSCEVTPSELEGPFDLVFLDGDHSYAETKHDFELVSPLVAPTGVLAFHDSFFFEGVSRVVGEALASARWQLGGVVENLCWIKPAKFAHCF